MTIALLQMTAGTDPVVNARTLVSAIADAAGAGATMLFTPEMSGLIDRDRARAAASIVAEGDDPVLARVCKAARGHRIWVHLGSLAVRRADGRFANRAFVIDEAGTIRARYDKLHLFDVDLPGSVVATPAGVLGLSICYDLRFPDLYRALSDAGATVLAVPAAFTQPTGAAHWHTLLRARAIEAGAWVIAAAQTGEHDDGRTTYGHSLVVDPWGEVVLDMGDAPGLGYATLDPGRLDAARARVPVLTHRRPIPGVTVVR